MPSELELQLRGYRLATVEIVYYLPDHPSLLQSFLWQHYDIAPKYPVLNNFLRFWKQQIEAAIHSVIVGRRELITPAPLLHVKEEFRLH